MKTEAGNCEINTKKEVFQKLLIYFENILRKRKKKFSYFIKKKRK